MSRKKKHPEHVNHERWLVSYADFITLLFAFFTVLYAISSVDQRKAGKLVNSMMTALNVEVLPEQRTASQAPMSTASNSAFEAIARAAAAKKEERRRGGETQQKLSALARDLSLLANDPKLKGAFSVKLDKRGVVVSLAEAGFFSSGSAELRSGALSTLDKVIAVLASRGCLEILVEGHTDNVPLHNLRYQSNWELATARATFVVGYLLAKHRFDPTRLGAVGRGEFQPVASNDTKEGRAHNRRVDLVVRFAEGDGAAPPARAVDPPASSAHAPVAPAESPHPATTAANTTTRDHEANADRPASAAPSKPAARPAAGARRDPGDHV